MSHLIYLAEDEENIRELIKCSLEAFGCTVVAFSDGLSLWEAAKQKPPQIVILDIMMPHMDGMQVISRLRCEEGTKGVGIIMVTAKSGEVDKVKALDLGADDYLSKPFGILELKSRVMALLRRCQPQENTILSCMDIRVDVEKHEVLLKEEEVHLSKKEYKLLLCLLKAVGKVVPREDLLKQVWGYEFVGETRTLDMHIKALREKLMDKEANVIVTVRGVGYKMRDGGRAV